MQSTLSHFEDETLALCHERYPIFNAIVTITSKKSSSKYKFTVDTGEHIISLRVKSKSEIYRWKESLESSHSFVVEKGGKLTGEQIASGNILVGSQAADYPSELEGSVKKTIVACSEGDDDFYNKFFMSLFTSCVVCDQ